MQFFFHSISAFFLYRSFWHQFPSKTQQQKSYHLGGDSIGLQKLLLQFHIMSGFFSFIRHLSYNCSIIISLVFRPAFNLLRIGWKLLGMSLGCDMALHTNHLMIGSLVHSHNKFYSHDSKTHSRCMQLLHSNGQLAGQMKYIVSAKKNE